jgi:hypothetical protein
MARTKLVNGERVPLTPEEEEARDAEEALWVPETDDIIDQEQLNSMLTSEGSPLRALAEVVFIEINALRVIAGQPEYTKQQFKAALLNKMRT